jgi:hypothetical protein
MRQGYYEDALRHGEPLVPALDALCVEVEARLSQWR